MAKIYLKKKKVTGITCNGCYFEPYSYKCEDEYVDICITEEEEFIFVQVDEPKKEQ